MTAGTLSKALGKCKIEKCGRPEHRNSFSFVQTININKYFHFKLYFPPQALWMFDVILKGLSFASEASRTNWFGLGCPLFCTQPSYSVIALTFILGFGLGAGLTSYLAWTYLLSSLPLAPEPRVDFRSSSHHSVLSESLNEPAFHSRRRNHRAYVPHTWT